MRLAEPAEILGQVWLANRLLVQDGAVARWHGPGAAGHDEADEAADPPASAGGVSRPISNVVFMGMGEPLLNYDAVLPALRALVSAPRTNGVMPLAETPITTSFFVGSRRVTARAPSS